LAIVVITGCSSGVGYESALAFARRGDLVYACVRHPERAASLAQKGAEKSSILESKHPAKFAKKMGGMCCIDYTP